MSPTNREPEPVAPFTLLLFSNPPRESPAIWRTAAAVTAVHALVLVCFLIVSWLNARSALPDGLTQRFAAAETDYIPITFDVTHEPPDARAPSSNRSAQSSAAPRTQSAARRIASVARPQQSALLGVPVLRRIEPPDVVPPRIPEPAAHAAAPESFATLPPRAPVQPVAPRGVPSPDANGSNGNANGNGHGDDVENMTLDELAREPRFTPFTQAPELLNRTEIKAFLQRRYPAYMSSRGVGGRAVLWLLIDPRGGIRKGLLLRSSGNAQLDDAALEAIDRMEFRPAINKGRPVAVWVQLPVSFQPNW